MTAATVAAQAVIRSRDVRSVLDGAAGTGGPGAVPTPDPDRVRAAVPALEELGLTVESIDGPTVALRGTPEAFTAAFGVRLDPDGEPDPGGGGWRLAGTPGGTSFAVTGGRLGGLLHTVLLDGRTEPATRPHDVRELFDGAEAPPSARDLLLGEVGTSALAAGPPAGLLTRQVFPAGDPATALARTASSLRDWRDDPLRTALQAHIADLPGRAAVGARIVEYGADPALADQVRAARPDDTHGPAPQPPLRVVGSRPDVLDDPCAWPGPHRTDHPRTAYFLRAVRPGWARAGAALEAFAGALDGGDRGGAAAAWAGVRGALTAFLDHAGRQRELDPAGALADRLTPALRRELTAALDGVGTALDAPDGDVDAALAALGSRWEHLDLLVEADGQAADADLADAGLRAVLHAAMVAHAFLAVTLDAVEVTLEQTSRPGVPMWRTFGAVPEGRRTVLSGSISHTAPHDLTAADLARHRALAAVRLHELRDVALHVVGAGNDTAADPHVTDSPSVYAVFAADAGNVLVAGGCSPVVAGWAAAEVTHGYDFALAAGPAAGAGPYRVRIPHVTATTKTATGGAIAFPTDGGARWWTGAGSSLSTPIVAAVCALVWSAFPQLTASQVRSAVLDGAEPLSGGAFHLPTAHAAGTTPAPAPPAGAGRVVLAEALRRAARLAGTALAAPPAGLLADAAGSGTR
ncbi:S8 family serine peptidase [Pseudonocardia sp.]|uniref:S8 family serine peptidase n=1 Tax=Pseudonocardia sp. TaxID=60912 RepID=UPI0026264D34|nr:S8 family serine peptidase [Pseudonocardia sp.]